MADGEHRSSNAPAIRIESDTASVDLRARVSGLYEAHRDAIYRFLLRQGLNPTIAQEITQDVFVDLFVSLQKGTQIDSEPAWLYVVAARAAVDYWRREHRPIWVELDSNPKMTANLPSREATPEEESTYRQRLARIANGLQRLPQRQRLCLELRMQGMRYRKIAKILGISISTVAERLVSALDRLRAETND